MTAPETNVLVVDDELQIRRALRIGLERNGYQVDLASTASEGLDAARQCPPDIIILDLALPDGDGAGVCRRIREWSKVPIIVLSVRDNQLDKIGILDLGADDYLTKPFSLEELLARMRAVMRRSRTESEPEAPLFSAGELVIDFSRRRVMLAGKEIHLTPTEYDLLRFMAHHPDRVLTHKLLLTNIWGQAYADDVHTLRVHIANLREKIEPNPARPRYLHTEPRLGYRFKVD